MEFDSFENTELISTAEPIAWPDDLPFVETDFAD